MVWSVGGGWRFGGWCGWCGVVWLVLGRVGVVFWGVVGLVALGGGKL